MPWTYKLQKRRWRGLSKNVLYQIQCKFLVKTRYNQDLFNIQVKSNVIHLDSNKKYISAHMISSESL